ncbi:SatD family protein [Isoalcanivorax indicus]|uniref:SatD family protein n=1 Tax=Isoalcanivorax indicus TaxID=2202653 RepID=UPI000DB9B064|nr:SatD family protein [Isoalcanivorax indicus]
MTSPDHTRYLVLIADIQDSRHLPDRQAVQTRLQDTLTTLNAAAPPDLLVSPYTITLGDEFQAVMTRADRALADIITVMGALHPVQLRFALATGALDTPVNPDQAIGMDGPAFHAAREAIEHLKAADERLAIVHTGESPDPQLDTLVTGTVGLLGHHLGKWKPSRLSVLTARLHGDSVTTIATRLGMSEQAVYKNMRAGELEHVITLFRTLTTLINRRL